MLVFLTFTFTLRRQDMSKVRPTINSYSFRSGFSKEHVSWWCCVKWYNDGLSSCLLPLNTGPEVKGYLFT